MHALRSSTPAQGVFMEYIRMWYHVALLLYPSADASDGRRAQTRAVVLSSKGWQWRQNTQRRCSARTWLGGLLCACMREGTQRRAAAYLYRTHARLSGAIASAPTNFVARPMATSVPSPQARPRPRLSSTYRVRCIASGRMAPLPCNAGARCYRGLPSPKPKPSRAAG